jgi:ribose/xylose/arabinose/galactoside ABC-type transport system permease subunit
MAGASARALASGLGIHALTALAFALALLFVPGFATPGNLANILTQSAALGLVAIGQTFVIIGGLIDLSVGQLLGLVVVLTCALSDGRSELLAGVVPAMLAMGAALGLSQGWLVNRLRIEPLILTFGTLSVLQGLIFSYTDRSVGRAPVELQWLANERVVGVPVAGLVLIAFALLGHALLTRTRFGLRLYATGSDAESARRAGVDVDRVRLLAFTLSGAGAALGGLLIAGRLGTGYPNAGQGFELDAIVAVVLGGASLSGGRGSVLGTLVAVLLVGVISNVLNLLDVSAFVQTLAKGLIVVGAIVATRERPAARWKLAPSSGPASRASSDAPP